MGAKIHKIIARTHWQMHNNALFSRVGICLYGMDKFHVRVPFFTAVPLSNTVRACKTHGGMMYDISIVLST